MGMGKDLILYPEVDKCVCQFHCKDIEFQHVRLLVYQGSYYF